MLTIMKTIITRSNVKGDETWVVKQSHVHKPDRKYREITQFKLVSRRNGLGMDYGGDNGKSIRMFL